MKDTRIRRMTDLDMEEILSIDAATFPQGRAMTLEDMSFLDHAHNFRVYVADRQGEIAGYVVYCKADKKIELHHICVRESDRLKGIGASLVSHLINQLSRKRTHVAAMVRESDLEAQVFMRAIGFNAIREVEKYKGSETYYHFVCSSFGFFGVGDDHDGADTDLTQMQRVRRPRKDERKENQQFDV